MPEDQGHQGNEPRESFKARAERIRLFELTADPNARALVEGKDMVGTSLSSRETFLLTVTVTNAVWIALLDLAEQLDSLLGGQIKPE
jgi:hypothetical protein